MSYVRELTINDLGPAGGFALWLFRAIASGCGGCAILGRACDQAFGDDGGTAFAEVRNLARVLGNFGGRRILLAESGCCGVTSDELSVVAAIAAAQSGDERRLEAHLAWLMAGREVSAGLLASKRVASLFAVHGHTIAPPSVEASAARETAGKQIYPATGNA